MGKGWLTAYLFLLPFLLSFGVFFIYALMRSVYFSFTDYDLNHTPVWVGFKNYIALFKDAFFLRALSNSIAYTIITTIIQCLLALTLAVFLNQKIKGKRVFWVMCYVPSILSSAATTLVFLWIYQRNGFLNQWLANIYDHLPYIGSFLILWIIFQVIFVLWERKKTWPASWFDPAILLLSLFVAMLALTALIGFDIIKPLGPTSLRFTWLNTANNFGPMSIPLWAITLQNIFTTIPVFMLLYLAALQSVQKSLYDAATIDGASTLQKFRHITIPQLAPTTFLVVTLSIIGTLKLFDQVALYGKAVPLKSKITLAYYIYNNVFPDGATPNVGMASASAIFLGMLALALILSQRLLGIRDKGDV